MPPRWLCVLIVASWLVLTGWLFYDELLPRLLPGQPPPVTIDLVEEAQTRRVPTLWTVYQDDRVVGVTPPRAPPLGTAPQADAVACAAPPRTEHPRRDLFEMAADFPLGEAHALAA